MDVEVDAVAAAVKLPGALGAAGFVVALAVEFEEVPPALLARMR